MSEHAWVLENVAGYLAGGLEPAERERLEQHTAGCPSCAHELDETRHLDRTLDELFANVHVRPELEDRLIQSLRQAPARGTLRLPGAARWAAAAAAVVLFGVLGSFVSGWITCGQLALPGMSERNRLAFAKSLKQLALGKPEDWAPVTQQITPFDPSFDIFDTEGKASATNLGDASTMARSLREGLVSGLKDDAAVVSAEAKKLASLASPPATEERLGQREEKAKRVSGVAVNGRALDAGKIMDGTSNSLATANQPAAGEHAPTGITTDNYYMYSDQTPRQMTVSNGPVSQTYRFGGIGSAGGGGGMGAGGPVATSPPVPPTGMAGPTDGAKLGLHFRPAEVFGLKTPAPARDQAREVKQMPAAKEAEIRDLAAKLQETQTGSVMFGVGAKAVPAQKPAPEPAPVAARKIIRSGEVEFEIDSFDSAVASINQLLGSFQGAFIATVNSDKLANGKVRGSVVVRMPPERLDGFLLALRKELGKTGELKGQRIGSQDITKQYTDLESRLRAARAMEERLIQIIKTGKGEIKDLIVAEKELGNWRTKIEEYEGELRYYGNMVSLSTLTINLTEKEIRAPASVTETERIQMGIEVEDVEKAQREALAAVAAAKGRVLKSELKQHSAGQYSAVLNFEVTPEAAGPLRDRLKQIGTVSRLDIDRASQANDGGGKPTDPKLVRKDVVFQVSIFNLANVAPRETVHISLAADDAEKVYRDILARARKATGRVVTSNLNRQRNEQTTGTINFEVKSTEADAVLAALKELGEVLTLQTVENPDTQNVTQAKRGFQVQIWALAAVPPRETGVLQVATRDVPAGYRQLQETVNKARGRTLHAQLNEQNRQNVTGQLDFEVRREDEAAIEAALAAIGDVFSRNVTRAQATDNATDRKVRYQVTLINQSNMQPRENITLGVEVRDVDQTAAALTAYVAEQSGQTTQSTLSRERGGRVTAKLVFDVPLASAAALVEKFKSAGIVRVQQASRNPQVPAGKLAIARLDVTLSNAELIIPDEEGLWPQIRTGLKTSFVAIAWSLTVVIIGVCFVLPWGLVLYGGYLLVNRLRRRGAATVP